MNITEILNNHKEWQNVHLSIGLGCDFNCQSKLSVLIIAEGIPLIASTPSTPSSACLLYNIQVV